MNIAIPVNFTRADIIKWEEKNGEGMMKMPGYGRGKYGIRGYFFPRHRNLGLIIDILFLIAIVYILIHLFLLAWVYVVALVILWVLREMLKSVMFRRIWW